MVAAELVELLKPISSGVEAVPEAHEYGYGMYAAAGGQLTPQGFDAIRSPFSATSEEVPQAITYEVKEELKRVDPGGTMEENAKKQVEHAYKLIRAQRKSLPEYGIVAQWSDQEVFAESLLLSGNMKAATRYKDSLPHIFPAVPPKRFGSESIQYLQGIEEYELPVASGLDISVAGRKFLLPRKDVGPPGNKWDTIFYLNISYENDPELFEAASDWFAAQLVNSHARIFIIPPSHKSSECLTLAWEKARAQIARDAAMNREPGYDIQLIQLLGGKNKSDLEGSDPSVRPFYTPITTPGGKYIGISVADARYLRDHKYDRIAVGDDVYSTGNTFRAIREIITTVVNDKTVPFDTLVLAIESPEPFREPPKDLHAAMYIVEKPGGISSIRLP